MSVQTATDTSRSLPAEQLVYRVLARLEDQGDLAPVSLVRVSDLVRGFGDFLAASKVGLAAHITPAHVDAYVRSLTRTRSEPSLATMHLRRSALRILFREAKALGLTSANPTQDIALPPRSYETLRPLTDREVTACRGFAETAPGEPRHALAWALAEAAVRVSELAVVRGQDLDLKNRKVRIAGSSVTYARVVPLTDWGFEQLAHADMDAGANKPLLSPSRRTPRGSIHELIAWPLRQAGLAKTKGIRPNSIAAWRGATEFTQGASIDEVAQLLGMRSLDRAAALIGFDWRVEP